MATISSTVTSSGNNPASARSARRAIIVTSTLALAALAVAGVGPRTARAAAPRDGTSGTPLPPVCSWRLVSSAAKGSTVFPEGNATTWTTIYYAYAGVVLHIHGQFPHARYMSFTVQPASFSDSGGLTFDQTNGDRIIDYTIKTGHGNVNTFVNGANRGAAKRSYDVYVRYQAPDGTQHGNVLYGGTSGLGALSYRVYAPDKGRDALGGVPLPSIDKVVFKADGSKPIVVHVPACSGPQSLDAPSLAHTLAQSMSQAPALTWRRALGDPANMSSTQDFFQGYSMLAMRLPHTVGLTVVRFKAPTFPNTYSGAPMTGKEQVRYWSVCQYELGQGKLIGCVADYQANLDAQGYATIVLGNRARRPAPASLKTANWLAFGREKQSVLIYRQLLPVGSFKQAIQRAPTDVAGMQAAMGPYFASVSVCTGAQWSANRCSAAH